MLSVLSIKLNVRDVLAIWGIVLGFLIFLKRLRLEDIEAVDFFLLALGFLHANLIDLAAELATLL